MKLTTLLVLLIYPMQVLADLKYVPKWTMVNNKACYEFSDAQKLFEVDVRLEMMLAKEPIWEQMLKDYKEGSRQLYVAIESEKSANETLRTSNETLNRMLIKETTRANQAEARQGPSVGWLVAGGVGLVAVGVVSGILLGVYVAK